MDNLLCLCDVWKGRSYVNSNVSVFSTFNNGQFYLKYYFLHHRTTPALKEIQLSVNCYVSVLIFHKNAKTITVPYNYNTWGNVLLIDVNRLKLESLFNKVTWLKACIFIKKETTTETFFCEYCKIFKNRFFIEHLFVILFQNFLWW